MAAALAGARLEPLPVEVSDAILCERWGVMLEAGGLMDQPYSRTRRMTEMKNVYDVIRHYNEHSGTDTEYSNKYPQHWEVVTYYFEAIREHGESKS